MHAPLAVPHVSMVAPVGPLATIDRKLRQVRKEATVSVDSGAEVSLAGAATFLRRRQRLALEKCAHECDAFRRASWLVLWFETRGLEPAFSFPAPHHERWL